MGFDDLSKTTQLYFEMYICSEILHGMLHSDFISLSNDEQLKWKLYAALKLKKEERHLEELKIKKKDTEQSARRPKGKSWR